MSVELRNQVVRPALLADEQSMIRERLFVGCDIVGPVIFAIGVGPGWVRMEQVGIDCPSDNPETLLFEVDDGRAVVGVVGLEGVAFERCRFRLCGFMGTRDALDVIRGLGRT